MDLVQESIQISRIEQPITHQLQLSEDVNVPDAKADVIRILQSHGKIYIKGIQKMEQYLKVQGYLEYQILYATDDEEMRIGCMEGTIGLEEMIYVEGSEADSFYVKCNQLDLQVTYIHSRKLSIKALVELIVDKTNVQEALVTTDVDMCCCKKYEIMPILEYVGKNTDTVRIKDEIKLSATKENIGHVLMSRLGSVKLDSRGGNGDIGVHGEIEIFAMYMSDDWKEDYVSQSVAFDANVTCHGMEDSMFHFMRYEVVDLEVEPQMDEDGEMRILHVEATLQLDISMYREQEVSVLDDMYLLEEKCVLERTPTYLESLLLQNQSKCKIVEVLVLPELKDELLQVCVANGQMQVEHIAEAADGQGIEIEGILHLDVLYIKGDDKCPYDSWCGMVPFTHVVTCPMYQDMSYHVDFYLEQVSISMAGNGEMEVKAVVNCHSFIRRQHIMKGITGVRGEIFTREELEKQAGIIGYIYKEGDDMWEVAKKFHTTTEGILRNNKLDEKDIKEGQKLLIFKENVSIL